MIPQSCLLIETKKFPVMPGEDEEIVNERMYGKALCQYLESVLPAAGLKVPSYCAEDWGWWLEVERGAFKMGLCIYSDPEAEKDPERYAILPSIQQAKKWSWSKFRNIDHSMDVLDVVAVVERVLKSDSEISTVTRHDDYPFE
ncbi:MAG: hypothetical protein EG825_05735 [Rhodocyclaceae bacterium]|nr:hypothetical protein [Rhodocyclaceae bacterium]